MPAAPAPGELLLDTLQAHGVDTSFLLSVDEHQGNAVIQVDRSGENAILLFGGSNQCVTERQVTETLAAFGPGDILLLQNEINNLPLIVDRASERGMRIVLNPSPYDRKLEAVDFSRLSWLFVNEVEGEQLAGSPDPEEIWRQIHRKYPGVSVLVTLGKQGSAAYRVSGDTVETAVQEAFPVDAVDTTAAGDTYTGFFIAAMAEGRALKDCMRLAAAASAICVTRHGAASSIPTREEAESFCAM